MWIALANHPGIETRDFSSLRSLRLRRRASLPVEVGALRAPHRPQARRRLGHDGDRAGRHEPAARGTFEARAPSVSPARGRAGHRAARRAPPAARRARDRRDPRPGPQRQPRLLEPARGDGGGLRRRMVLTGDIGSMDEDGYFFIVDRHKDMIISGGFNVYPQVIEQAVYEHPQVEEADRDRDPGRLSRRGRQGVREAQGRRPGFTLEDLQAFLADKIGRHEMPAALEIRDAFRARLSASCRSLSSARRSAACGTRIRPQDKAADGPTGTITNPLFLPRGPPMDLRFTEEELAFRDEVREFFRTALPDSIRPQDGRGPSSEQGGPRRLDARPERRRAGPCRTGRSNGAAPAGARCSSTSSRTRCSRRRRHRRCRSASTWSGR